MVSTRNVSQTIPVTLPVGAWVVVLDDIDVDESVGALDGFAGTPVFEDKVAEYNSSTGKLRFEDSDIGYIEFANLINSADGVQVIRE